MKFKKLLTKTNLIFIGILLLGIFLRFYQLKERFGYGHDHDLAAWMVKDILVNKHLRLIGQQTSNLGIFIGPLYYYFQVPFFALFKMDPIAEVVASSLFGLFGIFSAYYIFSRVFSKKAGLISAFFYSLSFFVVANDREAVPTVPVIIWSMWFFYTLALISKGNQKRGFLLFGILAGVIWHLNLALIILAPLLPVAFILSKKRLEIKPLIVGILVAVALSIPLIVFELRHNFIQVNAFVASLTSPQGDIYKGFPKFIRVLFLVNKNISNFIWGFPPLLINSSLSLITLSASFVFLIYKGFLNKKLAILLALWAAIYIIFFSSYSKSVSEYYLNGMFAVYLGIFSLLLSKFYENRKLRIIAIAILLVFGIGNINRFFATGSSRNGYLEKKLIASEIKRDSLQQGYPCLAISYITSAGYELGYRYFFYLENLKLNKITDKVPVYTIIYPLGEDKVQEDKAIGALGLIYPEYKRYPLEEVKANCSPENINLTGDMFGYTQ